MNELSALGEQVDQGELQLPDGLVLQNEIGIRQERLANLAKAKAELEERANERYAGEKAEYDAKLGERAEKSLRNKHKRVGAPQNHRKPDPETKTNSILPTLNHAL